ncbi:MAG: hypothetical protein A2W82_05400 [Sulfurimonas sp. RIFCSPLOWO2_12_36_12]|uniref:hypothetical protein n=1 Tax=Sulfurimonas sp. RIFCSPLOWO2_12_36_12 TaxID=1802253 RepID=UPI0008C1EBCD|nr:hypothetical protein [Sulfurimonas sp. RIFCSPLOWO2_12_36_12]OHD99638.1 MAG: hypothetical protein A3J26_07940 [Sulfurimonas sp. RIFCSPLOWO2_02_FULL_36_28]OHE01365.1 MAG: hypothetical protein A2W82_05400 [Sulfurimonas sp. RIFCSPLOWO2_12_36_12]
MRKLLLLLFLFTSTALLANFQRTYDKEIIKADFEAQKGLEKYTNDHLAEISKAELAARGIVAENKSLTSDATDPDCSSFLTNNKFTATIYSLDASSGRVECMFSAANDLYNPIGIFKVYYPKIAAANKKDFAAAQTKNQKAISASNNQFKALTDEKKSISSKIDTTYLSIPQLLLAGILTDGDVIDPAATKTTGRLQLQNGYSGKIYDGGETTDNGEIIKSDVATIFAVYAGISYKTMEYLMILIVFFALFGLGGYAFHVSSDKMEKKNTSDKKTPYVIGMFAGILLFFPVNDHDSIQDTSGKEIGEYSIMKTRYQEFEKAGYYLFTNWANDLAKVVIDAEMDGLIDKAGMGNSQAIIDSYAGMVQYGKLREYSNTLNGQCFETYNGVELKNVENRTIYSGAENALFPASENWAYASSWGALGGKDYYNATPGGLVLPTGYSQTTMAHSGGNPNGFYPRYAISFCGKNVLSHKHYVQKEKDYTTTYNASIATGGNDDKKIAILKTLTKFQYELYRDYGFLSILGLPVTKMQTEYLGGLYDAENNWIKKANEEIGGNWVGEQIHSFLSSLPYMLLPGVGTIYKVTSENAGKIGAAVGAVTTSGGGVTAFFGGAVGAVVGTMGKSAIGFSIATIFAKTILVLAPILAVLVIGIGRFAIILIKIFGIHFVSLLMMPAMFVSKNMKYFTMFTMRVFATMLELPIFVLAIWLAIAANSFIQSVGGAFSKKIIIGMLENNTVNSAATEISLEDFTTMNFEYMNTFKIFVLDGVMEISIAILSVMIIWKLIVTLHSSIFDMIELKGLQQLDDIGNSLGNEMRGFGGKI